MLPFNLDKLIIKSGVPSGHLLTCACRSRSLIRCFAKLPANRSICRDLIELFGVAAPNQFKGVPAQSARRSERFAEGEVVALINNEGDFRTLVLNMTSNALYDLLKANSQLADTNFALITLLGIAVALSVFGICRLRANKHHRP